MGCKVGGGEAIAVGVAPLQNVAFYLPDLILQVVIVPQGRAGADGNHALQDLLVQPGGGLYASALAHGVLQKLNLLGQGLDLGLVRLGLGVPVDQGHGLAHAHLFSLAARQFHNARLAGEDHLVPHQQAVGLYAVLSGIGVDQGGAVGFLEGAEGIDAQIDQQHRKHGCHHKSNEGFSLFHGTIPFLSLGSNENKWI